MPAEEAEPAIDNMGICLSMAGCKIFNISDRDMIGLALIMDVIKAGTAILINLSHYKRVEIREAPQTATIEPFQAGMSLKQTPRYRQNKDVLVETLYIKICGPTFSTNHSLTETIK